MTKRILILSILIIMSAGLGIANVQAEPVAAATSPQEQETGKKYTCPMHSEVVAAEAGVCPKCGMTLVATEADGKRPTLNVQHPMQQRQKQITPRMTRMEMRNRTLAMGRITITRAW